MNAPTARHGRPALTGRALGLGALVVLLVVVLASPVHRYLASRSDANHASQQLREDRAQLVELTRAKAQYGDPGYVQQQARDRLQYAMPGDTVYVVVDKGAKTEIEKTRPDAGSAKVGGPAWNQRLWGSVLDADK